MVQPIEYEKLSLLIDQQKTANKRVVLVGGHFDILHIGHARFLQQCSMFGDTLIVYVHNDKTTNLIKGPSRPIIPSYERSSLLAALRVVDYTTVLPQVIEIQQAFSLDIELIESLQPDVYIFVENDTSDFRIKQLQKLQVHTKIITVPNQSLVWSTSIIEKSIIELQNNSINSVIEPDDFSIATNKDKSKRHHKMMSLAFEIANSSYCKILKVGSILTNAKEILGQGFNRAPEHSEPCWCESHNSIHILSGPGHPPCFALHAELVAILEAINNGKSLQDSILYSTHCPCMACSKLLIELGVSHVVYCIEYTDSFGKNMLLKANVKVTRLTNFIHA